MFKVTLRVFLGLVVIALQYSAGAVLPDRYGISPNSRRAFYSEIAQSPKPRIIPSRKSLVVRASLPEFYSVSDILRLRGDKEYKHESNSYENFGPSYLALRRVNELEVIRLYASLLKRAETFLSRMDLGPPLEDWYPQKKGSAIAQLPVSKEECIKAIQLLMTHRQKLLLPDQAFYRQLIFWIRYARIRNFLMPNKYSDRALMNEYMVPAMLIRAFFYWGNSMRFTDRTSRYMTLAFTQWHSFSYGDPYAVHKASSAITVMMIRWIESSEQVYRPASLLVSTLNRLHTKKGPPSPTMVHQTALVLKIFFLQLDTAIGQLYKENEQHNTFDNFENVFQVLYSSLMDTGFEMIYDPELKTYRWYITKAVQLHCYWNIRNLSEISFHSTLPVALYHIIQVVNARSKN